MEKIDREELDKVIQAYLSGMRNFCEAKGVAPVTYLSYILGEYIYIFSHLGGSKTEAKEVLDETWDIALKNVSSAESGS